MSWRLGPSVILPVPFLGNIDIVVMRGSRRVLQKRKVANVSNVIKQKQKEMSCWGKPNRSSVISVWGYSSRLARLRHTTRTAQYAAVEPNNSTRRALVASWSIAPKRSVKAEISANFSARCSGTRRRTEHGAISSATITIVKTNLVRIPIRWLLRRWTLSLLLRWSLVSKIPCHCQLGQMTVRGSDTILGMNRTKASHKMESKWPHSCSWARVTKSSPCSRYFLSSRTRGFS